MTSKLHINNWLPHWMEEQVWSCCQSLDTAKACTCIYKRNLSRHIWKNMRHWQHQRQGKGHLIGLSSQFHSLQDCFCITTNLNSGNIHAFRILCHERKVAHQSVCACVCVCVCARVLVKITYLVPKRFLSSDSACCIPQNLLSGCFTILDGCFGSQVMCCQETRIAVLYCLACCASMESNFPVGATPDWKGLFFSASKGLCQKDRLIFTVHPILWASAALQSQ